MKELEKDSVSQTNGHFPNHNPKEQAPPPFAVKASNGKEGQGGEMALSQIPNSLPLGAIATSSHLNEQAVHAVIANKIKEASGGEVVYEDSEFHWAVDAAVTANGLIDTQSGRTGWEELNSTLGSGRAILEFKFQQIDPKPISLDNETQMNYGTSSNSSGSTETSSNGNIGLEGSGIKLGGSTGHKESNSKGSTHKRGISGTRNYAQVGAKLGLQIKMVYIGLDPYFSKKFSFQTGPIGEIFYELPPGYYDIH